MKKIILLLMALLPLKSFTQVVYPFENGSLDGWLFSPDGRWAADTFEALSGNYSLHHVYNSSTAATDAGSFNIAGLCMSCSPVTWSFTLRHGYDPSASNKWAFILTSDLPAGNLAVLSGFNGYAIGVNLSGNDDTLRLWKVSDKTLTKVISSGINWEKDIGKSTAVKITIVRKPDGSWILRVETTEGNLQGEWTGNESSFFRVSSAGIIYSYTASADQLLWLDDVSVTGVFIPDTSAPVVISVEVLSPQILKVKFDEDPACGILNPLSVSLSTGQNAFSTERISEAEYRIVFPDAMPNKAENSLIIREICDILGNCASSLSFSFMPSFAEAGDIIISEIMFDPVPPVNLPEDEYVEITNLTEYEFGTSGWMLIAGSDTSYFPDAKIKAGEIVILCRISDTTDFRPYGKVLGLKSFPSLNDSGEKLALRDGAGKLIHALVFGPELYNNGARSGGGWSAEMTDFNNPFNTHEVWIASQDPDGGTPGRVNSVSFSGSDNSCPQLISAYLQNENSLIMMFDETMKGAFNPSDWNTQSFVAVRVNSEDICDMIFRVEFEEAFEERKIYMLSFPLTLSDFTGNRPCQASASFGLPVVASEGEILFNEILFNPLPPGTDYIELFNNSSEVFDLSGYFFTSVNTDTGEESSVSPVCIYPRLILPGELLALTTEKEALLEQYPCAVKEMIVETNILPSMPDDEGIITLYNKGLIQIDRVSYSSSMHLIFISEDEGISLEKVSPVLPSGIRANWHSSAESCNWGTPGAANSVLIPTGKETPGVTLSSDRVTPDGDGYEDVVSININPGGEDNVITVTVFNDAGIAVRKLAERFYAGRGAVFIWDGTDKNSSRLDKGLYLIEVTSYNTAGEVHRWKKVCAVIY